MAELEHSPLSVKTEGNEQRDGDKQKKSLFAPHPDILEFERRYGQLGGVERRVIPLHALETRDTGEGGYNVTGYASVFDSRSLDLGGFVEEIASGAFDDVLSRSPDVHLLWD
ncbi:MAG: HK97 family phage prohead protease, partial [Mycobacteriales bacterium]